MPKLILPMEKEDMIFKGLEACVIRNSEDKMRCDECPYNGFGYCQNRLKMDMLEILRKKREKEVEVAPVRSKEPRYGMGYEYYDWECPTCGMFLAFEPSYEQIPWKCPRCGQHIKKMSREYYYERE